MPWSHFKDRRKIRTNKPVPLVDQPLLGQFSTKEAKLNPCQDCYQRWFIHVARLGCGTCLIIIGVALTLVYKGLNLPDLLVLGLLLVVGGIVITIMSAVMTVFDLRHRRYNRDTRVKPEVNPESPKGILHVASIHSTHSDQPSKEHKTQNQMSLNSSSSEDQTNI